MNIYLMDDIELLITHYSETSFKCSLYDFQTENYYIYLNRMISLNKLTHIIINNLVDLDSEFKDISIDWIDIIETFKDNSTN